MKTIYCQNYCIGLMLKGEKRYFKDMAEFIKKAFDEKYKGSWNVVVGIN